MPAAGADVRERSFAVSIRFSGGIGTDTSLATDDTNSPDLRMMEDDVIQGTTSAVNVTALGTAEYLCIFSWNG